MFPIVPAEVLRQTPLQHAVALMPLAEVASANRNGGLKLPEGAGRLAITVDGTESDDDLACLKVCVRSLPHVLQSLSSCAIRPASGLVLSCFALVQPTVRS